MESSSAGWLEQAIVRILAKKSGEVIGTGVAVTPRGTFVTCAHVVNSALGRQAGALEQPSDPVRISFPSDGGEDLADIIAWSPFSQGDVAVLRITESRLPTLLVPVRLHDLGGFHEAASLRDRPIRIYGFPEGYDSGRWAYGSLQDLDLTGKLQIQSQSILPGDSGSPVQELQMGRVIGIVSTRDTTQSIAFVVPTSVISSTSAEVEVTAIRRDFAPLTNGLLGLPDDLLSGVEQFMVEYLGGPLSPRPFGGRDEELRSLDSWLADPSVPYGLIAAPAGRGKSALLAHWASRLTASGRCEVALVPISLRFATASKSAATSLLGARLRHLYGTTSAQWPRDSREWLAEIGSRLREDRGTDQPPLVIILDGLDEAADWQPGQDFRFPPRLGRGVKVLGSARLRAGDEDASTWLQQLGWSAAGQTINLPILSLQNVRQVLASLVDHIPELAGEPRIANELYRLSEGDPLVLQLYLRAMEKGDRLAFHDPDELEKIRPGLESYFEDWLSYQRVKWGEGVKPFAEKYVHSTLHILSTALGPLAAEDLKELGSIENLDYLQIREAIRYLDRFITGDGRRHGFVFSHPRLRQFFYEQIPEGRQLAARGKSAFRDHFAPATPLESVTDFGRNDFCHGLLELGERFAAYCGKVLERLNSGRLTASKASPYAIRNYRTHLENIQAPAERFYELVSKPWLEAWQALEGTAGGFLEDVERAWSLAEVDRNVAVELKCVLCKTGLVSLSSGIPPQLLGITLSHKVITESQALETVRRMDSAEGQAEALGVVYPLLSQRGKENAAELARSISTLHARAKALAALAPHSSPTEQLLLLRETLELAKTIWDPTERLKLLNSLGGLYPHTAPLWTESVADAETYLFRLSTDKDEYPIFLGALIPCVAEARRRELMLSAMEDIKPGYGVAKLFRLTAGHIPADLMEKALELARSCTPELSRSQAFLALVPYVTEPRRHELALEAADMVYSLANSKAESSIQLLPLIDFLPESVAEPLLATALEELRINPLQGFASSGRIVLTAEGRTDVLAALASRLTGPDLTEAIKFTLDSSRHINDAGALAQVFLHLFPGLAVDTQERAAERIFLHLGAIHSSSALSNALAAIAPYLPTSRIQPALELAGSIFMEDDRVEPMLMLATRLPGLERERIVSRVVNGEWGPLSTTGAIRRAAPFLDVEARSDLLDRYLRLLENGSDWASDISRAEALESLVPELALTIDTDLHRARRLAASLEEDSFSRGLALASLLQALTGPERQSVVSEVLALVLELLEDSTELSRVAIILDHLSPFLAEDDLPNLLKYVEPGPRSDDFGRKRLLVALVPKLPEAQVSKVLRELNGESNLWLRLLSRSRLPQPADLPLDILSRELKTAFELPYYDSRLLCLRLLVSPLCAAAQRDPKDAHETWSRTLRDFSTRSRPWLLDCLMGLLPFGVALAGEEKTPQIAEVILDVCTWWS